MVAYKVYILYSEHCQRTYVGFSGDSTKRLEAHNSGKVKSTKKCLPWKIVYEEELQTLEEARKSEIYFKSGAGRRKIKAIFDALGINNQETCPI